MHKNSLLSFPLTNSYPNFNIFVIFLVRFSLLGFTILLTYQTKIIEDIANIIIFLRAATRTLNNYKEPLVYVLTLFTLIV